MSLDERIKKLERAMATLQRSPQLASSSILSGSLRVVDEDGNEVLRLGELDDGSRGLAVYTEDKFIPVTEPALVPDDGQAPATPANFLFASAPLAVRVSWDANTEVDMVNGHGVYEFQIGNVDMSVVYTTIRTASTNSTFNTGTGFGLYARVRAIDAHGNSSAWTDIAGPVESSEVSAGDIDGDLIPDDGVAPATPTGVTVQGNALAAFIQWTPNTEVDMVNGYGNYTLQIGLSFSIGGTIIPVSSYKTSSNSYGAIIDPALFAGLGVVELWVQITATDAHGNSSAPTAWIGGASGLPKFVDTPQLADNAITAAKILAGAVTAAKIAAWQMVVGQYIRSSNYDPSDPIDERQGFNVDYDGTAEFFNALIRGVLKTGEAPDAHIEIGTTDVNQMDLFSGHVNEVTPGRVVSGIDDLGESGYVEVYSPTFDDPVDAWIAWLRLSSTDPAEAENSEATLNARNIYIQADQSIHFPLQKPWEIPWGILHREVLTSDVTGITTGTNVFALAAPGLTLPSGRLIRVVFTGGNVVNPSGAGTASALIRVNSVQIVQHGAFPTSGVTSIPVHVEMTRPSDDISGLSIGCRIVQNSGAGTATYQASPTRAAYFTIEDMGPVPS